MVTIGLIGSGTIGQEIATAVSDGGAGDHEIAGIFDRNPDKVAALASTLGMRNDIPVDSVEELTERAELVIECASQQAVQEYAVDLLETETDLLTMSVGAFAQADLYDEAVAAARTNDAILRVPTGAIAGLDAIKAASRVDGLSTVRLTTTKPPDGLRGAPHIENEDIDLDGFSEPMSVFVGSAREAAKGFPANVNVAIGLSLAGIGPDLTTVEIVADPTAENNQHVVTASGDVGVIETTVSNVPSPTNPKTSYLAALSAIESLSGMTDTVRIGT